MNPGLANFKAHSFNTMLCYLKIEDNVPCQIRETRLASGLNLHCAVQNRVLEKLRNKDCSAIIC